MSYPIRAMGFGEILDTAFRVVRDHAAVLIGVPTLFYVPLALIQEALTSPSLASAGDTTAAVALVSLGVGALGLAVVLPLVQAAVIRAIGEHYLGRTVGLGEALRGATAIFLPLVGTWLLYTLAILGGLILLVIPGIYLMLAFLLIVPVMVLEGRFGTGALRRSRELMRGSLLRGFGVVFVGGLIASLLSTAAQLLFGFLPWVGSVGSGVAQGAAFAYTSAVTVLLYFDIRCRKEQFDLEHLTRLVESRGAGEPTPAPAG